MDRMFPVVLLSFFVPRREGRAPGGRDRQPGRERADAAHERRGR